MIDSRFWEACYHDDVEKLRLAIEKERSSGVMVHTAKENDGMCEHKAVDNIGVCEHKAEDSPGVFVHKDSSRLSGYKASGQGASLLHLACRYNCPRVVQYLIQHGFDHLDDSPGSSPLQVACERKCLKVIRTLIEHGADVNTVCSYGDTPLLTACDELGHESVAEQLVYYLVEQGANVNPTSYPRFKPLGLAVSHGSTKVTQYLLDHGSEINATATRGRTPLHEACHQGLLEMVLLLLRGGADVHATDSKGLTPLHLALQNTNDDNPGMLIALLEYGANPGATSLAGETPFQCIASECSEWSSACLLGIWAGISGGAEGDISLAKRLLVSPATMDGGHPQGITSLEDLFYTRILFSNVPLLPLNHQRELRHYIISNREGYYFEKDKQEVLCRWLDTYQQSLPSLMCLCRVTIRGHLGPSLLRRIRVFTTERDIPQSMIEYIYLYNEVTSTFPDYSDMIDDWFKGNSLVHTEDGVVGVSDME